MTCACSPSYSGGWAGRITVAWEIEATVSSDHATALQPGRQSKTVSKTERVPGVCGLGPWSWCLWLSVTLNALPTVLEGSKCPLHFNPVDPWVANWVLLIQKLYFAPPSCVLVLDEKKDVCGIPWDDFLLLSTKYVGLVETAVFLSSGTVL